MGVNAMQCLKCGREIQVGEVFCQECQEEMKRYPVRPGTVVRIPRQPQPKRTPERRPAITPERKIEILTRRTRILGWLLTLAAALVICLGALTLTLLHEDEAGPAIGQNYSSAVQPEEEENFR